jgi:hypothetical protein
MIAYQRDTSDGPQIFTVRVSDGLSTRVTNEPQGAVDPGGWAPDGGSILFSSLNPPINHYSALSLDREGDAQQRDLPATADYPGGQDDQRCDRGGQRDAHEHLTKVAVPAGRDRQERRIEQMHEGYPTPNNTAFAPNAWGAARATTSIAAIAANIPARTRASSGSSAFVSHA